MKKLLSAVLAAAMLVILSAITAAADSSSWNDDDIMPLLDSLGIMNGDGNGNYFLDSYVSREEMAKIAVNSSSFKDETAVGMKVSPFKDIDSSRWSAPYILNGTQNGLFNGYLDGTFKPFDMVTYEEAVTMMLKVLGYTDDNFGVSYPYGQVNLAKNIDLTDNVDSDYGCWLTRRQVARLVYNALDINPVSSNTALISNFDSIFVEDAVLLSNEADGRIYVKSDTGSGKYNTFDGFNYDYIGMQGDAVIRNGKDLLCFVPDNSSMDKYVIYSLLNSSVIGYSNGAMTQIDVKDDTICYKNTSAYSYSQIKPGLEMGDVLKVKYDSAGSVDYIIYEEGNMEGPTKVTSTDMVSSYIRDSSTQVMRDGNKASSADVQVNDVIYYSADLNMVLAYSAKATGIYESALPSREQPNTVTISGKEYAVEGVQAFNDLSSSGPFRYGDTITVILGKDGDIAGVVTASSAESSTKYGFVVSAGKKNFSNNDGTTYSSNYVDIIAADGNSYEYTTSNDCSGYINSVVKASFANGTTSITTVSSFSGGISGKIDADNLTIGSDKIAADCKILDTVGFYTTDTPLYKPIYLQRLDGINLDAKKVRYYSKNSKDEITEMILWDVTGDCYSYGIITGGSNETQYTVDIDGSSYNTVYSSGAYVRVPCKAYMKGGSLELKGSLTAYNSSVSNLTQSLAKIGGTDYLLSDKVIVYLTKDGLTYNKISINDAVSGDYSYTAYYDKKESEGGRIRVIIAKPKQ